MDCRMPGLPVHHQLPEFTQTHVHPVGDAIKPSHPLSSPSPPAFNLFQHQGLFYESVLHIRWPNYWSFIFSISTSNEYSGLISFRMDWFHLLAVQGTVSAGYNKCPFSVSVTSSELLSTATKRGPVNTAVEWIHECKNKKHQNSSKQTRKKGHEKTMHSREEQIQFN